VVRRTLSDDEGQVLEYYVAVMPSDLAKTLTFVPVFEGSKNPVLQEVVGSGEDEGYQRPGSRTRMTLFGDFLGKYPLSVTPGVVFSGRENWEFEPSDPDGDVGTLHCFGPAAIIDGQHRVGGYVHLYESDETVRPLEFILVPGLSLAEETKLFLDINNNQKSVISGLTAILSGSDQSLIGRALLEDDNSPLQGLISIAVKRPGHLFTMNAMTKNISRTFSHGAFEETSLDDKVDIMKDYWTRIADAFVDEWADSDKGARERVYKLCETTGLIAFSLAAQDILGPNYIPDSKIMNWPQVADDLRRLAEDPRFDLRKEGPFVGLTGEVGGAKIHRRIQMVLAAHGDSEDSHLEDLADE
jgi:DNA sulfur modification protein DndB